MQFSDEFISKWEHIIKDVDITDLPLECIKKVVIKLAGRKQHTINIQMLKKQGLTIDQIEEVMSRTLTDYNEAVLDLDFTVDVGAVAQMIQPQTDKILKGIS
jgi:hypothetical protein